MTQPLVAGLDEAGRGAVIGPLVVAAIWLPSKRLTELADIGVRDSKAFGASSAARATRAALSKEIRAICMGHAIVIASAEKVDDALGTIGLNALERELARQALARVPADANITADGERLFSSLRADFAKLTARNKADAHHLEVAAASILAKVERDRIVEELLDEIEPDFRAGMGYPNASTAALLRRYHAKHGGLPPHVRQSWKWRVIEELSGRQPTLPFG